MNKSEKDKLYWLKQMSELLIRKGEEYDLNGADSVTHTMLEAEYQIARENYFRLRGRPQINGR